MSIVAECKRKCSRCGKLMMSVVADDSEKKEVRDLLERKNSEHDFCVDCITGDELHNLAR